MERDLTRGSIRKGLVLFSLPLIAGNLLQQCYNIVDTWVVGRFLGSVALAAVGQRLFADERCSPACFWACAWAAG